MALETVPASYSFNLEGDVSPGMYAEVVKGPVTMGGGSRKRRSNKRKTNKRKTQHKKRKTMNKKRGGKKAKKMRKTKRSKK